VNKMKGKTAGYVFLGICVVLAALLLARIITHLISGFVFAVALITLAVLSGKFRRS
jgi:hypothetical protein